MKKLIGIFALMAIMLTSVALGATCTFDQPATTVGTVGTYIKGASQNLSVVVGTWPSNQNTSSAKIVVSSGTISGALSFNQTAGTNTTAINFTIDTSLLLDDQSYTFTAYLYNASNAALIGSCTSGALIPDNSQPKCTHLQSSRTAYNPTQTWTILTGNASSATIKFGSNAEKTMIESISGDRFTWTGTKDSLPMTIYPTVTGSITDGLNTSSCELTYIDIDDGINVQAIAAAESAAQSGQGAKLASAQTQKKTQSNSTTIIVVLLIVGGYFALKKGKK